jgi:hypothetical protein
MMGGPMKRRSVVLLIVCAPSMLALAACGAAVAPMPAAMEPVFESCAVVRERCGAEPMRFVRASATGLTGLDGARARFAIRYLTDTGVGIDGPRRVAVGGGTVTSGSFEACVCLPSGGNNYPQLSAVVFAPGSTGERAEDVRRAFFSQRFATLGTEELTQELSMMPTPSQVSAALASLVERTLRVELRGVEASFEGRTLFGAVIADERPIPSDRAQGTVASGAATLQWTMPGRASATERALLVIDANGDRRCGEGDRRTSVPITPGATSIALDGARWDATAAAVREACEAIAVPGA